MSAIAIRQVRKSYGSNAVVHGVDLDIRSGEFVVILGPSGCGKSTLLRMVAGLEAISGGEIAIDGRVVNKLEPRERGCAMVFQNYALYPHMTVAENIGYALKVAGVAKPERARRIAAVAKIVDLEPYLDRKPAALSGGQRQRVAMGRAIIREPKVFLFDEPLSNLDAKLRVQMRAEIRRLHRRLGATSIFVTHDQVEAMTLADRLVVMNGGRVEQVGTPADVYRRPASRFVAGFVGSPAMNLFEGNATPGGTFAVSTQELVHLAEAVAPGTPLVLGIRPEDVRLLAQPEPGALPATVDFVEELGASRVVYANLDSGPQVAALAEGIGGFEPGERAWLRLEPSRTHLFDPATGARIEPRLPLAVAAE
ncbi:ABC transporter ATP-binding protein [Aureimonas leprariae]|uniref:sn-glycerol-3-phosphate ABC transporter ATP-binding protein UgpC n=1 Tax=Plantimonas leprariae TaxID=2615207 RepID=A0A7V7U092_9HYPH|nr:sn-glycerol-3-phosphate ABC transporter ATP-binding protein UgpC [Aureimonas leprariae]KAB0680196.1 sn-glycerol-3-phosphate ABC transporter ATP-binding protein UgpC [Aureimonas leprariae]